MSVCPFCEITNTSSHPRIERENQHAFVIRDGFPITDGHTLIIPKRHVGSFFDITPAEHQALFQLIEQTKPDLDLRYQPAGYNIGINDGPAAGQTVPHLHIHLIPRYHEPDKDPRGGVRWLVPEKADYWSGR
jgi:diadenosine tetraphosphate (Ap4A) HIT family hydrolase